MNALSLKGRVLFDLNSKTRDNRRVQKTGLFISILIVSLILAPWASAQEMTIQTEDATIGRLREQCDTLKTTLRRIHTNDALLRVNIGQAYSGVSAQFMARLNSRVALNRMNSTELIEITNRFEQQRGEFSKSYANYEAALSGLLKVDCRKEPVKFYAGLLMARDERAKLAQIVQSLNGNIREYQVSVETMQQSLRGGGTDGN